MIPETAFILIDMQDDFLNPDSPLCIKPAAATIPDCARALNCARENGLPVFIVTRAYRADGSDIELARHDAWAAGGRRDGAGTPPQLSAQRGDYHIIKPRWSAFFGTNLDLILRRLGVRTVVLAGTTTPNCIRATCYDALALDYNTVILDECCSSQTDEIQEANYRDMKTVGAKILPLRDFLENPKSPVDDPLKRIQGEIEAKRQ